MKKFIAIILTLMLVCGAACAESAQELIDIINDARLKLTQYYEPVKDGMILYEDESIKITATSGLYQDEWFSGSVRVDVVIENYIDTNLNCSFQEVSINGWTVSGYIGEVLAKKKAKTTIMISSLDDTDLESIDEIQEIEGIIYYYSDDSWESIGEGEFYWIFEH